MQLLTDADDRPNLARACALMSAAWLPAYLAKAIAEEETGEKARTEMMAALLARSPDLATALRELANTFQALRPSTEDPGETAAKRLARTLAALRNTLLEVELDAGDEPGKALYEMLALPLSDLGKPQTEKVQIDLVREALLTVHDIVRTRISVVADPEMYSVVGYCRRLIGSTSWPKELNNPIRHCWASWTFCAVIQNVRAHWHAIWPPSTRSCLKTCVTGWSEGAGASPAKPVSLPLRPLPAMRMKASA